MPLPTRDVDTLHTGDWPSVVREHGLRATTATIRVLRLLAAAPAPLTHEEVQESLAAEGSAALDRVTLYRVLERLAEVGLCDTFANADRRTRFVLRANGSGHVFECLRCHKVVPLVPDPELPALLDRLRKSLRRKGLDTQETMVTLRGICGDCETMGSGKGRS
ncbi:MAG: transcriptional repressor [Acidovorax sp.]